MAHACPCCGYLTFPTEPGGSYFICPVCFWEDDLDDLREPDRGHGGPNYGISLNQSRDNFREFGAARREDVPSVRPPRPHERPPDFANPS